MILNELNSKHKLNVIVTQELCVYSKTLTSYSACWDNSTNSELKVDNIDDSYGLDIEEKGNRINVYIPRNSKAVLKKSTPNIDCTVYYKNIECDLTFDDEDAMDMYFNIIEE